VGVPCVAYDVAGLRDSIRRDETGILVKPSNVEALAEAIILVLTNENLRIELSQNAIAYSKGFSWDKVADEFMNIIRTA
jgi:glycosyltransferase involved in cell wall biosynthesis